MKKLSLVLSAAALTAAFGLPAWSALQSSSPEGASSLRALLDSAAGLRPLVLADNDDGDEDDAAEGGRASRSHVEDDDAQDCEEDDGGCSAAAPAAPAGSLAPPQNGLFGSGTPRVQVK